MDTLHAFSEVVGIMMYHVVSCIIPPNVNHKLTHNQDATNTQEKIEKPEPVHLGNRRTRRWNSG